MTLGTISPLRLALVDDHVVFREGLAALLAPRRDVTVVGQAGSAAEAFVLVDRVVPDVIVLDLSLPDANGLDVARQLGQRTRCKILALTMHDDRALIDQALNAGIIGYAVKSEPAEAIVKAIHSVARRELYLPSTPGHAVVQPAVPRDDVLASLSRREREIFELVIRGLTNDEVAHRLCISVKTVETHRARINRKCQVHSTAALVRIAARMGMFAA